MQPSFGPERPQSPPQPAAPHAAPHAIEAVPPLRAAPAHPEHGVSGGDALEPPDQIRDLPPPPRASPTIFGRIGAAVGGVRLAATGQRPADESAESPHEPVRLEAHDTDSTETAETTIPQSPTEVMTPSDSEDEDPEATIKNRIVDALPFDREVEQAFISKEVAHLLRRREEAMGATSTVAAYNDYYGKTIIRFVADDTPGSELPDGVIAVPRSEWGRWSIVESGVSIYAEPATTTNLERDAQPRDVEAVITAAQTALEAGELTPEEAGQHLRQLGHLPFALEGIRGMQADAIADLQIDKSVVVFNGDEDCIVVHSPRTGAEDDPTIYDDPERLLDAQSRGDIESVRFNLDGSFEPHGFTHELRYARGGLVVAMQKFLRRWTALNS